MAWPPVIESIRKRTRLPLDVHLMIVEPERYIEAFVHAGADLLTVHVEACPHLNRTLNQIREAGAKAGAAVLIAGSAIFGAQDLAQAVRDLRSASEVLK